MLCDAKLDLIDVCLPPVWHAESASPPWRPQARFCEKPIALNPADATAWCRRRASGKRLMIGHVLPFVPEYRFAYEAITAQVRPDAGRHFKRIISIPVWLPDFYNPKKVGGPMLDLHVHDAISFACVRDAPGVQSVGTMRGEWSNGFDAIRLRSAADGHGHQRRDRPAGRPSRTATNPTRRGHAVLRLYGDPSAATR